ncbi:MAG: F0F1 ATP synthase subunit delta [Burkholderiaceae bacterium]
MAELATIARPYAEALYQAAEADAKADLSATSVWLDELAAIASDEQMQQFASNPKMTDEQVLGLIKSIAKANLSPAADNFLQAVVANGRLKVLPEIALQFQHLKNKHGGRFDGLVQSAFAIDSAALVELSGRLEQRFGRKLNLSVEVLPELIGGIRVVVGDEVLDTSVKARLQQMKAALTA